MKKFSLRQLFGYGFAVLVQKLVAFLILPLIASHLTVSEFGLVNQVISIGGFYILIVMLGLDESIAKKRFDSDKQKDIYVANGFFLLIANVVIFSTLASLFSNVFYKAFLDVSSQSIIWLSILLVSCNPFYLVYLKILRLSNASKEFFFVVIFQVISQSTMMLVFVIHFGFGSSGVLLAHFLTSLIFLIYVMVRMKGAIRYELLSFGKMKELFIYGVKIAPHSISTWGLWGLSVVYTGKYLGSEHSAHLVAVNYIPLIANVISYAFFYTYQPWLYSNLRMKVLARNIKVNLLKYAFFFGLLLVVIFFLSGLIFGLIFDERYTLDNSLVILLLFASLFQFLGSMFTYVLYYFEKYTTYVAISTVSGSVVNLILLVTLSEKYGLLGVAFSFLLSQIIIMVVRSYVAFIALNKYEIDSQLRKVV